MKRLSTPGTVAALLVLIASISQGAANLNMSKSNLYRLTYPADLTSVQQVKALLTELDKLGPADEARLKSWLPANFKRYGIPPDRVKKIVVLPPRKDVKGTAILLLTDPAGEAEAVAFTVKSSKSNTSD